MCKRVRSQIFRTGRSKRGVRAVFLPRMTFVEGRQRAAGLLREAHALSSSCYTKMAQCHFTEAPDGAFGGVRAGAARMSLSSPCRLGNPGLPLPPRPVPDRGFSPFSTFPLLPPPVASPTSCQWKRGAATADLGCRTDKSRQTSHNRLPLCLQRWD